MSEINLVLKILISNIESIFIDINLAKLSTVCLLLPERTGSKQSILFVILVLMQVFEKQKFNLIFKLQ